MKVIFEPTFAGSGWFGPTAGGAGWFGRIFSSAHAALTIDINLSVTSIAIVTLFPAFIVKTIGHGITALWEITRIHWKRP